MSSSAALPLRAPRRVIIAGANGYMGSRLAGRLLTRGHSVTALVRSSALRCSRLSIWPPPGSPLELQRAPRADAAPTDGIATAKTPAHRPLYAGLANKRTQES